MISSTMRIKASAKPACGCAPRTSTARVLRPAGRFVSMVRKADPDQAARDNRSDQLNPNNPNYQGGSTDYQGTGDKADLDNHSNQLNPNNPQYNQGADTDSEKK